ncbi:MAG: hypothetical protein JWN44_1125 [Myxococcales bacterium]|nr:hypothetical protein [Myxococcales bacterium]
MRASAVGILLLAALTANAAEKAVPLEPTEVRVAVANRSQKALGLRPLPTGGWRLDLPSNADTADIIDLTPNTPARTITLSIVGRALRFDAIRFTGGHVYRIQLKTGPSPSTSTLVYLYPQPSTEPRHRAPQRVKFSPDERPTDDSPLSTVDKGSL